MTSKETIGIVIRAAKLAQTILKLLDANQKFYAVAVMQSASAQFDELATAIEEVDE